VQFLHSVILGGVLHLQHLPFGSVPRLPVMVAKR
jgi:hypothetical protein